MADRQGNLLYRTPAAARILGQRGSGITAETGHAGQPLWSVRRIRDEGLPEASANGSWQGETAFLDPDGNEVPFSQIIIAHYGESPGGLVATGASSRVVSGTPRPYPEDLL